MAGSTNLGLLLWVRHLAENKQSDVVCAELCEDIVGDVYNPEASDLEACLFQRFALSTLGDGLAMFEVAAWKGPLPFTFQHRVSAKGSLSSSSEAWVSSGGGGEGRGHDNAPAP